MTVSRILPNDRMPRFSDGTFPDMILNIHSLITRRSLGMLYEGLIN